MYTEGLVSQEYRRLEMAGDEEAPVLLDHAEHVGFLGQELRDELSTLLDALLQRLQLLLPITDVGSTRELWSQS